MNTITSSTDFEGLDIKGNVTEYQIGSAIGSAGGNNRAISFGHWDSVGAFDEALVIGTDKVLTGPSSQAYIDFADGTGTGRFFDSISMYRERVDGSISMMAARCAPHGWGDQIR